ncbi:MAG: hypothetical protein U0132_19595, partial [Gemmatimonadaceae bacterium]
ASGPSGSFYPGIARVDFLVQAGTSMVPIGSSTQPSVMDNGLTRFWTWQITWTPGIAFGTGPQVVMAVGYDAWGRSRSVTPLTSRITITDP